MIDKKNWEEFMSSGLLWFINTILHTFGWSIVIKKYDNKIIDVYPARVKFRGFSEESNTDGYIKISNYLKNNIDELAKEANEEVGVD